LADEILFNSSMTLLRRVWRYQRDNHNLYIKEQTTQWRKEKVQKEKQRSKKYIYKTKGRATLVDWGELRCSRRVCRSCSTSGTRHVNLATNTIISREWGKDREVFMTNGTYRWSLWHRYAITVNQVIVETATLSKWWLHLYQKEPLFQ